jgi:DNA-binding MarR family transcriptional regulator
MDISFEDFVSRLSADQRAAVSHRTLGVWHRIYIYIEQHGSADTVDDDAFVQSITRDQSMTRTTLARHLRRMSTAGVIEGHVLVRRADHLTNSLCNPYSPNGGLPSRFVRYTLPGQKPTLELRRAAKATKDFMDFFASDFPKEMERFSAIFSPPPKEQDAGNA